MESLALSEEEIRSITSLLADTMIDYERTLPEKPVFPNINLDQIDALLADPEATLAPAVDL